MYDYSQELLQVHFSKNSKMNSTREFLIEFLQKFLS